MELSTEELAAVAADAVRAGGIYLSGAFRNGPVDGEFSRTDVKAVADRESERRVQAVIAERFPEHAFHGEEAGRNGDHDYRWVVDPLDGTNNFASGYPKFATAAAVLYEDEPVVSAIYEPLTDSLYLAQRGAGATLNGQALTATTRLSLDRGTIALVIGLPAVLDESRSKQAERLELALRRECKRVVTTWAPCVDWGLLARGSIEGLVGFYPDIYEQHAGSLLAAESGVDAIDTVETDGRYVGSADPETTRTLRAVVDDCL